LADDDAPQHKPIFHYENGVPVFNPQRIDDLAREQEDAKKRDAKYKDDQLTVNRRLMIFTGVLAVCSILAGGVTGWQVHVASQTLAEIQQSRVDTAKMITASETQASAATKNATAAASFSASADGINIQTKMAVDKFDRIAKASEHSIRATQQAAQDALNASINASRLDQRAWVGLLYPVTTFDNKKLQVGVSVVFKWRFKNSGKTPAINVAYDPEIIFREPGKGVPDYDVDVKDNAYSKLTGIREASVIAPGEEQFITFPTPVPAPIFFGPKQFVLMENNATVMYVVGKVTYNDIFPGTPQHSTKFCVLYDPIAGGVGTCPINNTMN
jgi:hypothetical protein